MRGGEEARIWAEPKLTTADCPKGQLIRTVSASPEKR